MPDHRNNHGDPTKHLAAAVQAALAAEASKAASKAKAPHKGGAKRRRTRKSLFTQLKSLFTRKRK